MSRLAAFIVPGDGLNGRFQRSRVMARDTELWEPSEGHDVQPGWGGWALAHLSGFMRPRPPTPSCPRAEGLHPFPEACCRRVSETPGRGAPLRTAESSSQSRLGLLGAAEPGWCLAPGGAAHEATRARRTGQDFPASASTRPRPRPTAERPPCRNGQSQPARMVSWQPAFVDPAGPSGTSPCRSVRNPLCS